MAKYRLYSGYEMEIEFKPFRITGDYTEEQRIEFIEKFNRVEKIQGVGMILPIDFGKKEVSND